MAKNIVRYDLLISCPGDVQTEIDLIKESVEEFNEKFSDTLGLMVQVRHWKNSSFSQSGDKPQALLNSQFVNDCDAAVAVLWTRFGTPTDRYGSGTEEEIELMLESGKQVFMYFSEKQISPSNIDYEQYKKVNAFRDKYKDKGIYFTYTSDDEFRKLFFSHLTKFFLTKKQSEEYENRTMPNLELRGIDENENINEYVVIRNFVKNTSPNSAEYVKKIRTLFEKINKIEVENDVSYSKSQSLVTKKIKVNEGIETIIRNVAEQMGIELSEGFFSLGELYENTFASSPILGQKSLVGGENEKRKYKQINELYRQISELLSWAPIEEAFSKFKCLYLALENNGTSVDEDIEITLKFDKNEVVSTNERPVLSDEDAEYLVKKCDLSQFLEIKRCSTYLAYEDSIRTASPVRSFSYEPDLLGVRLRDYQKEYAEEFDEALGYEIYDKEDYRVLKLQMDYIKHNSIVAFPTPILLKNVPSIVVYEIRSKYISEVIKGELKVIELEETLKD